jgi:hypothetical protein
MAESNEPEEVEVEAEDEETEFELSHVNISRTLTEDNDLVFVEWSEDSPFLELLGLLDFARNQIWSAYNATLEDATEDDDVD